jgi:hypothetical protein
VLPIHVQLKMFVAAQEKEPKLNEVKLTGYFSTIDMCSDDNRAFTEVDGVEEDAAEEKVDDAVRFALSAETKPKLRSKRSFREDLKVSKKVLNIPSDATVTDDELEVSDTCPSLLV